MPISLQLLLLLRRSLRLETGVLLLQLFLLLRLGKLAGLRLQGEHWFLVGILGCLPPPLHLLRVQAPLTAVSAEFGGVQASGLQHHRELIGGAPALRSLSDAGTTSPCNRQDFLQL